MLIIDWSSDVCSSDLREGDLLTFMDSETFEQTAVDAELVGEPAAFLQDGMAVQIASYEEEPLAVVLPETVVMEVVEADAVAKGQTASSSSRTAEHTSELQSHMRLSYTVFYLTNKPPKH